MAFESDNSAPKVRPSERPPESKRTPSDIRSLLPKNGETIRALRQVRTSISGIFAAVKESKGND